MHNSSDALDADVEYELCSASSSNETADDLPGLGRVLGNLYTSVGRKLENGLGNVAVRMGRGPNATALKIQRILGDKSLRSIARRKKLRKKCKSLARYIKSNVPSTQEQALDKIIELSIIDDELRQLLSVSASENIRMLYNNPYMRFNMKASLQSTSRRALTVLNDSANAKINFLVDAIFSYNDDDTWWSLLAELNQYYIDPELSFLVIRHVRHRLQHGSDPALIQDLLLHSVDFKESEDSEMVYSILEKNIEWSEFDEVFRHFSEIVSYYCGEYYYLLDMSLRNLDKLPKSLSALPQWIVGLDADDLGRVTLSYSYLYAYSRMVRTLSSFSTSLYMRGPVAPLGRRLDNRLDMALAYISNKFRTLLVKEHGTTVELFPSSWDSIDSPYSVLAIAADSEDLSIQQNAIANIRIALSVSRYTQKAMLDALSSTVFSRKVGYASLVQDSISTCAPKACPSRGKSDCEQHRSHKVTVYRHCSTRGELIHVKWEFDYCNGECGAAEEHSLTYDPEDTVKLNIDAGYVLSDVLVGHHPIVAGHTVAGDPIYFTSLIGKGPYGHSIIIPSGARPENIKIKRYHADGSIALFPPCYESVALDALRYHPQAYEWSEYYPSKGKEAGEMDPTGPFSWKFHRKLLDTPSWKQLCPIHAPLVLWREVSIEPDEESTKYDADEMADEECISDDSNGFFDEVDSLDIKMQEERIVWSEHKIATLLDKY